MEFDFGPDFNNDYSTYRPPQILARKPNRPTTTKKNRKKDWQLVANQDRTDTAYAYLPAVTARQLLGTPR